MTIRETIRRGHDTLARFPRCEEGEIRLIVNIISDDKARRYRWEIAKPPIQYPQSLGELCLEIAAKHIKDHEEKTYYKDGCSITQDTYATWSTWTNSMVRQDLAALRRALYHRSRP